MRCQGSRCSPRHPRRRVPVRGQVARGTGQPGTHDCEHPRGSGWRAALERPGPRGSGRASRSSGVRRGGCRLLERWSVVHLRGPRQDREGSKAPQHRGNPGRGRRHSHAPIIVGSGVSSERRLFFSIAMRRREVVPPQGKKSRNFRLPSSENKIEAVRVDESSVNSNNQVRRTPPARESNDSHEDHCHDNQSTPQHPADRQGAVQPQLGLRLVLRRPTGLR
jgi:hypothetical protein